jgi:hypothetical protein
LKGWSQLSRDALFNPHFVFTRDNPTILAMDRHGKTEAPNQRTGFVPNIVKKNPASI